MAGALSDFLVDKILNQMLSGVAYTWPTILYLELYTVTPTSAGGGTPVTGGSYARKAVTANATNFPTTSTQISTLNVLQDFVTATAAWGDVVAVGLFDDPTAGNFLAWDDFASTTIADTNTARIAVAGLTVALQDS